ncbi:MAG: hypothetical protein Q7U44_02885 [Desulfuromonadales bacterium]|nr:hypothetical protein [Desulfuromonadales bacterium]
MDFICGLKTGVIKGVLDTDQKVREARTILEESTESIFKELEQAKMASWEGSRQIFLD